MRTLKFAILFLLSLAAAAVLATNVTPRAEFSVESGYPADDLQRLSQELRIERVQINLDPLGVGPDVVPTLSIRLPVLILGFLAFGLLAGWLLTSIGARGLRRELREKRDEAILLKAELHRARQTLKTADHPSSAAPPARR